MKRLVAYFFASITALLLSGVALRAEISAADQQALQSQYVNKVLIFRKSYRILDRLEVKVDGTVPGNLRPGLWSMDGACQVKELDFRKDAVTFKCAKLWANVQDDGQLHYFPASAALKGKTNYPEKVEVVFRTDPAGETVAQVAERVNKIFLSEQDSKLTATPAPISAYIQKQAILPDIDPTTGAGFDGTPPKAISTPTPDMSREALLVGQVGRESFVVLVDAEGRASVLVFTRLLQYGLEETTIDAVKRWKFEPAMKDGKPTPIRIAMDVDYKRPPAGQ
ncbi:MAG: energy transducer TonB [Terriglobia bacterium]